jgi:hypothetical protein
METTGVWFRSVRGRWMALGAVFFGVLGTFIFVVLDEYFLDLPGWLPFLPSSISNGWVPLAALLLLLIGTNDFLKWLGASTCEVRQTVFTLLLASFVTLTFVGIFLRGEGMALIIPWS